MKLFNKIDLISLLIITSVVSAIGVLRQGMTMHFVGVSIFRYMSWITAVVLLITFFIWTIRSRKKSLSEH